ncbi:hypothetical protein ncot_02070 [Nocardioides sp. JQ2195]|uniref:hypothetical protein n=1 Tax=Nocardioides sp. JQ2195 TaxID=2592334 RepID=UPI00143EA909|nr:hypothetical protein [Nocardioides sp. JQ2195]QIX25508.1 hypothetical protein ncot_02070 [Nocardioides sp. JQ2195]
MRNVFIQGLAAASLVIATTGTVGLASSSASAATTAVSAPVASQVVAQAGCVSKKEFRKVKKGMTKAKVARIFGTKGTLAQRVKDGRRTIESRGYKGCPKYSSVGVAFIKKGDGKYKLANKLASWQL